MEGNEGKVLAEDIELTSNTPAGRVWNCWFVAARPSEYLVVYRDGVLDQKRSGQGARIFKWPRDSVAIVPTTLKEVVFMANQLTADNVDVRIRGMVLYRIADPLRIAKLINFALRQEAEAKLARMIADLCRSSTKWLVANMPLEECIRRRKEGIAQALREQIARIVSADGAEGWGVEIVTIDIQDVFVQDDAVFQAMQTAFRVEKGREAELATLTVKEEIERRRIATERALDKDRHDHTTEKARLEGEAVRQKILLQRQSDEEQFQLDRFRVEQNERIQLFKTEQLQAREQLAAESKRARVAIETEAARTTHDEELRSLRERLAVENTAGRASLERLFLSEGLPHLSDAVAAALEGSRFHVYQGGAENGAAGPVGFALAEVLGILQERFGEPAPNKKE